ncbi:hypothetical protein BDQ12DRAFT_663428 [Crucibulum laeve]|uniref:Uncharacterized protein n=1 Tax=Crucibulum laeve TaxID=68775 RepID=A0A5C3MM07_9AGAR|nr:hypothetical protein BDQ12DRAFT_663428 [Crucibulum laeve]
MDLKNDTQNLENLNNCDKIRKIQNSCFSTAKPLNKQSEQKETIAEPYSSSLTGDVAHTSNAEHKAVIGTQHSDSLARSGVHHELNKKGAQAITESHSPSLTGTVAHTGRKSTSQGSSSNPADRKNISQTHNDNGNSHSKRPPTESLRELKNGIPNLEDLQNFDLQLLVKETWSSFSHLEPWLDAKVTHCSQVESNSQGDLPEMGIICQITKQASRYMQVINLSLEVAKDSEVMSQEAMSLCKLLGPTSSEKLEDIKCVVKDMIDLAQGACTKAEEMNRDFWDIARQFPEKFMQSEGYKAVVISLPVPIPVQEDDLIKGEHSRKRASVSQQFNDAKNLIETACEIIEHLLQPLSTMGFLNVDNPICECLVSVKWSKMMNLQDFYSKSDKKEVVIEPCSHSSPIEPSTSEHLTQSSVLQNGTPISSFKMGNMPQEPYVTVLAFTKSNCDQLLSK